MGRGRAPFGDVPHPLSAGLSLRNRSEVDISRRKGLGVVSALPIQAIRSTAGRAAEAGASQPFASRSCGDEPVKSVEEVFESLIELGRGVIFGEPGLESA